MCSNNIFGHFLVVRWIFFIINLIVQETWPKLWAFAWTIANLIYFFNLNCQKKKKTDRLWHCTKLWAFAWTIATISTLLAMWAGTKPWFWPVVLVAYLASLVGSLAKHTEVFSLSNRYFLRNSQITCLCSWCDGLTERLEKELIDLLPEAISEGIKVTPPPYGTDSAWFGAKIVSNVRS